MNMRETVGSEYSCYTETGGTFTDTFVIDGSGDFVSGLTAQRWTSIIRSACIAKHSSRYVGPSDVRIVSYIGYGKRPRD